MLITILIIRIISLLSLVSNIIDFICFLVPEIEQVPKTKHSKFRPIWLSLSTTIFIITFLIPESC